MRQRRLANAPAGPTGRRVTANHSLALTKIEPAHDVLRIEPMTAAADGLTIMTGGDATSLGGCLRG